MCRIAVWFSAHYDFFKDFATPTASIIAAIVAAWFAWRLGQGQQRLGKQQADTAELQAQIAHDRLRLDQFDKRYEVFDAVRQLTVIAINDSAKKDFSIDVVIPLYRRLHEAPLFFSKETCDLIEVIRKDCQRLFTINASTNPPPPPDRSEFQEKYVLMKKLAAMLDELPQRFIPELGLGR